MAWTANQKKTTQSKKIKKQQTNEEKKTKHLENFKQVRYKLKEIEEKDAIRNFQPPIDGIAW